MQFRAHPILVVTAIVLATAVLVSLGTWQLYRNESADSLAADRNARLEAPPAPASEVAALPLDEVEYRRVDASGRWDHDQTMVLANRARFGRKGEEVVTPLVLDDGRVLLVNRGWYPEQAREPVLADLRQEERATVEGLALPGLEGGRLTDAGTWTHLDPAAMQARLPYQVEPWFVIQGELVDYPDPGDGSLPVQQYLPYQNTTPHLEYAATWYGLAAALIAIGVIRFIVAPRRERAKAAAEARESSELVPTPRR